jgi:hypothetical protein
MRAAAQPRIVPDRVGARIAPADGRAGAIRG